MKDLKELIEKVKKQNTKRLAVAAPQDLEVLMAVVEAYKEGIAEPVLIGDMIKTKELAINNNLDIDKFEAVHTEDLKESAEISVKYVSEGKADFLMKGLIDTSILLKEVLNKDYGLRTDSLLSHVMVYQVPTYHKLLFLSDGGMNIYPNFEDKIKITKNCIKACLALGKDEVKVAVLAAKEKVSEKMQATVDADKLKKLCDEGEFGKGVILEGPLALDLAISEEAAKIKNFDSKVAGDADILIVPNIEMGNGIGKSLTYFANALSAGIIMGAKAPVVLVSRADSHEAKLNSIALGSLIS